MFAETRMFQQPSGMAASLAERVRTARERKGLTQADLAIQAGVRQLAISEIERGVTTDPKSNTLAAIADALDESVDALLGRTPKPSDESHLERDDDVAHDPVWQAFLASDRGARTTDEERRALSGITRRMGRARSVEAYEGMLSILRTGFTPEQTESIETDHQARRASAVANGRTLVDRKALQERARKKRTTR